MESEEAASESDIEFRGMDGTVLRGTLRAARDPQVGVLLVHGLTGDRNEHGLYSALAVRLDGMGALSLRFDLRGHGRSGGRYEDVTMSGATNDIGSAYELLASRLPRGTPVFVVAASFAGGVAASWAAAKVPRAADGGADGAGAGSGGTLAGLVLLCPLFDYVGRMLSGKPYWSTARMALTDDGVDLLAKRGWLEHAGRFKIGRALLNEICCFQAHDRVEELAVPLLTIHGSADDVAPHETSHRFTWMADDPEFATIDGAGHMFVHPDDDDGAGGEHPATRRYREAACSRVLNWIDDRI